MHSWKLSGVVAALVIGGVLGAALPGLAGKDKGKKPDSAIGYVDLGQVTDQIKRTSTWVTMTQKFDTERKKFQDEIAYLTKIRYLTPVERKQLDDLKAKTKVSDQEKARIAELEGKSDALDREFQTLAGTEKPGEMETKRINELAKVREDAIGKLQEETDKRSQSLRDLESKVLEEMQGRILKIVEDISQKENLTLVIDRQAILFGGRDLTQNVLTKLGATARSGG